MASECQGRRNRLLAALTSEDHCLLAPHLKVMSFELGLLLQEPEKPIEYVYFPHQGMISLLAVMSRPPQLEAKAWSGPCPDLASAEVLRGPWSRRPS